MSDFPDNHLANTLFFQGRKNFLKEHVFPAVKDKITLEIGCFDGYVSSVIAEYDPLHLILLEADKFSLSQASFRLTETKHTAIYGDMHLDLNQVGKVDVAILLGVIYHSCAPLHLLEQLINHCDPDCVFIDNPANIQEYAAEDINTPGNRYTIDNYKSCRISSRLNDDILSTAMNNLGYDLVWRKIYPQGSMSQLTPIFNFVKKNTSQNILRDYNE